ATGTSAGTLTYSVTATELMFDGPEPADGVAPGSTVAGEEITGVPFNAVVAYTDVHGNLDSDVNGDAVTASWSGAGVLSGGASSAVNGLATFNTLAITPPGVASGMLTFADDTGGLINVSGMPAVATFDLVGLKECSTAHVSSATTITSVGGAQTFWTIAFSDAGVDAAPTVVNSITFSIASVGGVNANDFAWTFNSLTPTSTTATSVTFAASPVIQITNGASNVNATLSATPIVTNSTTMDNSTVTATLNQLNVVTDISGSGMTALTINMPAPADITVAATQIQTVTAPAAVQDVLLPFNAALHYVDANGNRDLDISDSVMVTWSGAGAPTPSTLAASAGLVSFTGANQLKVAGPGVTNGTLTIADETSGTVNLSSGPLSYNFDLLTGRETIFTAPQQEPIMNSTNVFQDVWKLNWVDAGSYDMLEAWLTGMTFNFSATNGFGADAFEWQLVFNGMNPAAQSAVSASTVTFGGAPIYQLAHGATGIVTLQARFAQSNVQNIHGTTFSVSLPSANISVDPAYSRLQPTQGNLSSVATTYVQVSATELRFTTGNEPAATQTPTVAFAAEVAATDDRGNVDTSIYGEVITLASNPVRTISGNTTTLTAGIGAFPAINLPLPGFVNGSLTFSDEPLSGNDLTDLVINPFGSIATDDLDSDVLVNSVNNLSA
ncbi:MAG: hypothetical protein KDB07_02750, partial [Planctomycetes bacterium]|nr:hypothetical protein [Planctomycetota bacterium]